MTGARIIATLDDATAQATIDRFRSGLGVGLMRAIGTALVEEVNLRFEEGKDVWGVKWAPLSPAYAAVKRGPGILRESRMLQRSITYQVLGPGRVAVGSSRVYAAIHQFGGTIKPKNGKVLVFHIGRQVVHARSVTIPQRPYLGFGPNDRRALLGVLDSLLKRSLRP
jgi:phage gpG-like protein